MFSTIFGRGGADAAAAAEATEAEAEQAWADASTATAKADRLQAELDAHRKAEAQQVMGKAREGAVKALVDKRKRRSMSIVAAQPAGPSIPPPVPPAELSDDAER